MRWVLGIMVVVLIITALPALLGGGPGRPAAAFTGPGGAYGHGGTGQSAGGHQYGEPGAAGGHASGADNGSASVGPHGQEFYSEPPAAELRADPQAPGGVGASEAGATGEQPGLEVVGGSPGGEDPPAPGRAEPDGAGGGGAWQPDRLAHEHGGPQDPAPGTIEACEGGCRPQGAPEAHVCRVYYGTLEGPVRGCYDPESLRKDKELGRTCSNAVTFYDAYGEPTGTYDQCLNRHEEECDEDRCGVDAAPRGWQCTRTTAVFYEEVAGVEYANGHVWCVREYNPALAPRDTCTVVFDSEGTEVARYRCLPDTGEGGRLAAENSREIAQRRQEREGREPLGGDDAPAGRPGAADPGGAGPAEAGILAPGGPVAEQVTEPVTEPVTGPFAGGSPGLPESTEDEMPGVLRSGLDPVDARAAGATSGLGSASATAGAGKPVAALVRGTASGGTSYTGPGGSVLRPGPYAALSAAGAETRLPVLGAVPAYMGSGCGNLAASVTGGGSPAAGREDGRGQENARERPAPGGEPAVGGAAGGRSGPAGGGVPGWGLVAWLAAGAATVGAVAAAGRRSGLF